MTAERMHEPSEEHRTKPLYILLISVHGLIRGHDLELGRDADTGGQTLYVVELARALGERPEVGRVDLVTRLVDDQRVSEEYAAAKEPLSDHAQIVRIEAGPPEYIRKEELWDHLDVFADNILSFLREQDHLPDLIHSHYADAGYVGVRLSHLLGRPLVHTGHSLGRVKRRRLLASGLKSDQIEHRYNMVRRIDAEEEVLSSADLVVTSTHQEVEEQYALYDYYTPKRMRVIPPGTDLQRFRPAQGDERDAPFAAVLQRFLRDPDRPIILALSRPDERKNIATLIEAYGASESLQATANLVIVAGNRDDIRDMAEGPQDVLTDILLLIDRYDLYGKVAIPKKHRSEEVPIIYRLTALSQGVFVNPALTEPFGLTLIEAAASGLPLVATDDGGPRDIIGHCRNGELIDPLDRTAIGEALLNVLSNPKRWRELASNGLEGVHARYSWNAHAETYLDAVRPLLEVVKEPPRAAASRRAVHYQDRALFSDLDQSLLGDPDGLAAFVETIREKPRNAVFGIATGRRLDSALRVMKQHGVPTPDVLITSLGTEIYYAPQLTADVAWSRHIDHTWSPRAVRRVLAELTGLELQQRSEQSRFKISYFYDAEHAPGMEEIARSLLQAGQTVNLFLSFGQFLDIIPARASKGLALRYFADQWNIALEHVLAAGGSGADEDMLRGKTLGVVVANRHHEELSHLPELEHIYFSKQAHANGILEAIQYYDFYGECRVPEDV